MVLAQNTGIPLIDSFEKIFFKSSRVENSYKNKLGTGQQYPTPSIVELVLEAFFFFTIENLFCNGEINQIKWVCIIHDQK